MPLLSNEEREQLLAIARSSIESAVSESRHFDLGPAGGALSEHRGAFVTLRSRGRLRGCVGQPEAGGSLADTVARCAVLAASEDDRFSPLRPEELPEIRIEISVLSPVVPVRAEQIELGRHGLLIRSGAARGLLLPQVATEHHLTREQFLRETCLKAGLKRDAWQSPSTEILAFTAEIFSEPETPSNAHEPQPSTLDSNRK